MPWHFAATSRILSNIHVSRICRPVTRFTAYEIASLVIDTIENDNHANLSRGFK
ncbi:hypothetical protein D3C86_2229730 [compost metagenome]